MEGSLAIIGFWLFMIALVMKKPLLTFIEKTKAEGVSNSDVVQKLQQLELHAQTMARDLAEIRALMQSQSTDSDLIRLKEQIQEGDRESSSSSSDAETLLIEPPANSQERNDDSDSVSAGPATNVLGAIVDKNTIRFERSLPAEVELVWKYLSDAYYLERWLGKGNIQPFVGGRVELNFEVPRQVDGVARVRGLVKSFDAPQAIAYSWVDTKSALQSDVSFKLTGSENETQLVLVHSGLPEDKLAEFLSAWHARFDALIACLKNFVPPDFAATFRKVLPIYTAVALSIAASAPASARVDDASYHTIRLERSHLLTKYDNHWHDADQLEKEIVRLKHENSSSDEQTIDQLDRKLKDEYRDLHQIELDIRALDQALL